MKIRMRSTRVKFVREGIFDIQFPIFQNLIYRKASLLPRKGETLFPEAVSTTRTETKQEKRSKEERESWIVGPNRFWIKVNNRGRAEGDVPFDPPC